MKTLVVLFALAAFAVAAPALHEDGVDTHRSQHWPIQIHPNLFNTIRREKKSPSELTALDTRAPHPSDIHTDHHTLPPAGRAFTSKTPLIVKKKSGYRLYRDSEEEKAHADSHETCGRQVKVKLCDEEGKFREMFRKSTHAAESHTPEDDMKHSIMMAKEAVESLQRDLKKMERQNTALKMAHDSESDTDLHKDIEVARQALEHIHDNFGNLETMSVHATSSGDSETTHDMHITIARSEEEKMAQWTEAMNNIQKNVEIARNIENSFKAANQPDNLLISDQSEAASTKGEEKLEDHASSHTFKNDEHQMRDAENIHQQTQPAEIRHEDNHIVEKDTNEHLSDLHARLEQQSEDDMNPSASEAVEMKAVDIKNHHTLRSENHQHHGQQKNVEENLEDNPTHVLKGQLENQKITEEHHELKMKQAASALEMDAPVDPLSHQQLKEAEDQTETKLDDDKHSLFKTSENVADSLTAPSSKSIKTLDSDTEITGHQRSIELKGLDKHEASFEKSKPLTNLREKSVNDDQKEKSQKEIITDIGNVAALKEDQKIFESKPKNDSNSSLEKTEEKDNNTKAVKEIEIKKFHNFAEQPDNTMEAAEYHKHFPIVRNDHNIDYNETEEDAVLPGALVAEERSEEEHLNLHQAAMHVPEDHVHFSSNIPAHWAHQHRHLHSMNAADDFKKDLPVMEHMRHSHPAEQHFNPHKMGGSNNFETSEHAHSHAHAPSRFHNMMPHSQMHDMNGMSHGPMPSKFHSSMRDAMEGLGSEHMFRWRPTHESSRNAYGSSISSSIGSSGGSVGAVGVFPNANTGSCGIPLLLSCSPSVVSGSLAKAGSAVPTSYPSSSYRAEEEYGFHNKRDVKMTKELRNTNVLRTHGKTGTILENKM